MLLNLRGIRLWCPDSKKVIQSTNITFNETAIFFPRQDSTIPIGNLQDDGEKVELKVSSYAPQGGDSVPHSSSKDHIDEINPDIHDITSSKEHQTSVNDSVACNRPRKTIRKPARYSANYEKGLIAYSLAVAQEIHEGI